MAGSEAQNSAQDWGRLKREARESAPAAEIPAGEAPPQLKSGKRQTAASSPSSRPIATRNWFLEPQERNADRTYKAYPAREGNVVTPYRSSKMFFEEIATAIENAEKSVDIITMGLDTDINLKRVGTPQKKNRVLSYKRAYPAEPSDKIFGSPDPDSYILSDLLTRVARREEKKIDVRMLVSAPHCISECFRDPLHLWYRSKVMPGYERLRFAFRAFNGAFVKPPAPPVDLSMFSLAEWAKAQATLGMDALVDILKWVYPGMYKFIHAHHQKLVVVDIEEANASAFVLGSNFNEEYWDDHIHAAHNDQRAPYAPWRDVGLKVQGPVLHDISKNIEENWRIMEELFPDYLIVEGKKAEAAGMFAEEENPSGKSRPLNRAFNYNRLGNILEKMPMLISAFQLAKDDDALRALAVCSGLTLFMDMIGGLASKAFDLGVNGIQPVKSWGGKYGSPDHYKQDRNAVQQNEPKLTVQFDRTFCQEKAEEEFSIVRGMYRAVTQVRSGGLIYIENQYFRDLHFIELLKQVCHGFSQENLKEGRENSQGGVKPYLIIVTSATTLSSEGILSEGPSFIAYKMLEKSGIPFHFCRLRTKEHRPELKNNGKEYAENRPMIGRTDLLMECLWDLLKGLLTISPLVLLLLRSKFRTLRNSLWAAVPLLLEGAKNAPSVANLIADFDHLTRRLLALDLSKDPREELEPELRGVSPEDPETPDPQANDVWSAMEKNMPTTAEGVPVPDIHKEKGKAHDPGNIYVHSKVLIVDQAFAMVGSANHNERSMWHDTEDMLAVRGSASTHFPGVLRQELLNNILSTKNIINNSVNEGEIFKYLGIQISNNAKNYSLNKNQDSFPIYFIPKSRIGSFSIG